MASDEPEIRTVHSIWIDAVNAGDLARLLTLVAEDVVFLTPGQAPFGRESFSSNFMAAHQQMRICCTSELEEVVVVGEVAYTRSRDALSVTPRAGGKAAQLAGHAGAPGPNPFSPDGTADRARPHSWKALYTLNFQGETPLNERPFSTIDPGDVWKG